MERLNETLNKKAFNIRRLLYRIEGTTANSGLLQSTLTLGVKVTDREFIEKFSEKKLGDGRGLVRSLEVTSVI